MNPDFFTNRSYREPVVTPESRRLNDFMSMCRRFFSDRFTKDADAIRCFNDAARLFESEKKSQAQTALREALERASSLGIEVNNER